MRRRPSRFFGFSSELLVGPACSDYGLVCGEHQRYAVCEGAGGDCSPMIYGSTSIPYEPGTCFSANEADVCVNGGLFRRNCPEVANGFTCQQGQCGLGAECNPLVNAACDGTALVFCHAGRMERLDCTTLGFTGCNARYGVCSPSPWP